MARTPRLSRLRQLFAAYDTIPSSRAATVLVTAALGCACGTTSAVIPTPSPAQSPSCAAAPAAQFDFWVGSWKGTWTDAQGTATATDVVVKNACEIDETFTAARFLQHTGYSATSKSHYDPGGSKWVQDYSDSVGERSRWLGEFTGGAMTLIGPQVGSRRQKISWYDIRPDSWIWEYDSSTDGTTWSALVVVSYKRT